MITRNPVPKLRRLIAQRVAAAQIAVTAGGCDIETAEMLRGEDLAAMTALNNYLIELEKEFANHG